MKPPAPPAPSSAPGGEFWYGAPALWWTKGYDWRTDQHPALTVTGRRLDAPAPPLRADVATNASAADIGSAMLVGVEIPARGCWEITSHLGGTGLTFVVLVR